MKLPGIVHKNLDSIHRMVMDLLKVVNGGVEFGGTDLTATSNIALPAGNLNAAIAFTNFPAPDADVIITHNLGRVPVGFIVCYVGPLASGLSIYQGSSAWTTSTITLRSNVSGANVKLLII